MAQLFVLDRFLLNDTNRKVSTIHTVFVRRILYSVFMFPPFFLVLSNRAPSPNLKIRKPQDFSVKKEYPNISLGALYMLKLVELCGFVFHLLCK